MNSGWRFARIGGVDFLVKPSLLVMGAALVFLFIDRFEHRSDPVVLAVGFVVGLYASVFIHEVAHVVAARLYGMPVRSVTLHLMGGETAIEGDSRTPMQELVTAGIGPLASLGIGLACLEADDVLTGTAGDLATIIGTVNLFVAAFNMIPGLPLDGGRVARAVVWALTGKESVGVTIAGWIGRVTAVALIGLAAYRYYVSGETFQLLIAGLVAYFLWTGASEAVNHADRSSRVNSLSARSIARPAVPPEGAPSLHADLQGSDLLRAISEQPSDAYLVTESDGTVVGVLTLDALDAAYRGDA